MREYYILVYYYLGSSSFRPLLTLCRKFRPNSIDVLLSYLFYVLCQQSGKILIKHKKTVLRNTDRLTHRQTGTTTKVVLHLCLYNRRNAFMRSLRFYVAISTIYAASNGDTIPRNQRHIWYLDKLYVLLLTYLETTIFLCGVHKRYPGRRNMHLVGVIVQIWNIWNTTANTCRSGYDVETQKLTSSFSPYIYMCVHCTSKLYMFR